MKDWSEVYWFGICLFIMALLLTGCSNNIHVKGWGVPLLTVKLEAELLPIDLEKSKTGDILK